jgi:hypothetical protein
MAEEGYGLQISIKRGDDMLNVRGSDTDELLQILTNLVDAAKDDDLAAWIVDAFQVGEKPKAVSRSYTKPSSSRTSNRSSSNGGEPSEKQLAFAKRLHVKGYREMDKTEISAAIDEALAAQEEDDDDD